MIDSQNNTPIRCENCGFRFEFAVSDHSMQAICPACGGELSVTHCRLSDCSEIPDPDGGSFRQELFKIGVTRQDLLKCQAQNCPRMKRSAKGGVSQQPETSCDQKCFEQTAPGKTDVPLKNERQNDSRDRQGILLLTVGIQVLVLLFAGFVLFKALYRNGSDMSEAPAHRSEEYRSALTVEVAPSVAVLPVPARVSPPVADQVRAVPSPLESSRSASPISTPPVIVTIPPASNLPPVPNIVETTTSIPAFDSITPQTPPPGSSPIPKTPVPDTVAAASRETAPPKIVPAPVVEPVVVPPTIVKPEMPETVSGEPRPVPGEPKPVREKAVSERPVMRSLEAARIAAAETLVDSSIAHLAGNPEKSLEEMLKAMKIYEEVKREPPSVTYWMLAQAYAALNWGKMFLSGSPGIEDMTVSHDSRWLMTHRQQDGTVWIWDLVGDKGRHNGFQLNTGTGRFVKMRFTPDLRLIVGGQADGSVRIWDMSHRDPAKASLRLRETVPGLTELCISPDGRWLVAYGEHVEEKQFSRNNRYLRPQATDEWLESVLFVEADCAGKTTALPLIVANDSPETATEADRPLSTRTPSSIALIGTERDDGISTALRQVAYLSSGSGMVAASSKVRPESSADPAAYRTVWLWDLHRLQNGTLPAAVTLQRQESPIRSVSFNDEATKLAVGTTDGVTRVYDLNAKDPNAEVLELRGHRLDVTATAFAPGGRWIATGSRDNTIRLWLLDGKTVPESVVLNGHLGWITSLIVDRKGGKLYSGSYDKTVRVWNVHPERIGAALEQEPLVLQNNQGVIRELTLSTDETKLISRGGDGSLRIRNLDGRIDNRHSVMFRNRMLPINGFILTPDNRWLIFSYLNRRNPANSGIRFWPLELKQLSEIVTE